MARRDKGGERQLALRRMERLAALAVREAQEGRPGLADRYGRLVLALARKHQTGLPRHLKPTFCRSCGAFQATHGRTRLAARRIVATCLRCGAVRRRPLDRRPSSAQVASRAP